MTPILSRPVRNIAPNIVYSARGDEVETVIIDGKVVVDNYKVLTMNENAIIEDAQKAGVEMADAATEDYYKADSLLARAAKKGLL